MIHLSFKFYNLIKMFPLFTSQFGMANHVSVLVAASSVVGLRESAVMLVFSEECDVGSAAYPTAVQVTLART